jgi:hypothetical protein
MLRPIWIASVVLAGFLAGCGVNGKHGTIVAASALVSRAPEAGIVAIAAPGAASVRVLYARNGGMVLLGEVRVPAGDAITGIALSADGSDLVVDTDKSAYTISTRTWVARPARVLALQRAVPMAETAL